MFHTFNKMTLFLFVGLLGIGLLYSSCNKDDDDADLALVELYSFGPSPVLRGGDLRFIGHGLDNVSAIILPENVQVTSFKQKTSELIVLTVPEETVNGEVVLKTPEGDIRPKTLLAISEPITITSISPASVRPGEVVTIEGTYLNLVKEVVFASRKAVGDTAFISQSQTSIEVTVPPDAQTGPVTVSNGEADPILVTSEEDLDVVLPVITSLSPEPVVAGTTLTIEGTDLDLTREIIFTGGERITDLSGQTADKIEITVPANAKDGPIQLVVASGVQVTSPQTVTMAVPTITSVAPNPAKTGQEITVQGENLQLITQVTFGGDKTGEILDGGSATEITVRVPVDAQEGPVSFRTAADKTVTSSATLTLVKPAIASFASLDVLVNGPLTITGTNLDIVATVRFSGDKEVAVSGATETELTVTVPTGATSGPITLIATNGDEIVSSESVNVMASTNVVISSLPATAKPGSMISIVGEHLDEVSEIIFPGDVPATMYIVKTETLIQVFVPQNVTRGEGVITFRTIDGQTFDSEPVLFQGIDPVVDPNLVFFNFDNRGSWWGDVGAPENDPSLSLDGSNYFRVNGDLSGWKGFFWRNSKNDFPADVIGANVEDYVLKFDINIMEPITGGEFAWRLKGTSGDFWHYWKPWAETGSYQTDGWVTVTIPLTDFYDGGNQLSDLSTIDSDFGVAFNNGSSHVNIAIDNVRFEHK